MEELTFHLENVVKVKDEDMEDFNGPLDLILSLLSLPCANHTGRIVVIHSII